MTKILQFPTKKNKINKVKKDKSKRTTNSTGLTPFSWMKFNTIPGLYAEFNNKLLDKLLSNFDDFNPPPPTCA